MCTRRVIEVAYRCATSVQFEKSVDQRIGRMLGSGPSLCLYSREVYVPNTHRLHRLLEELCTFCCIALRRYPGACSLANTLKNTGTLGSVASSLLLVSLSNDIFEARLCLTEARIELFNLRA